MIKQYSWPLEQIIKQSLMINMLIHAYADGIKTDTHLVSKSEYISQQLVCYILQTFVIIHYIS